MGRWCEVKCNCPNREPIDPYDKEGQYQCGHTAGLCFELWPGDLFAIGYALEFEFRHRRTEFAIFIKVGNWRIYHDERLVLSLEEAALWQLEIEQLQKYLTGENYLGWEESQGWDEYFNKPRLLYGDVSKTLLDGLKLCQASLQISQPIEFFW
jgi:hypothetical protein